MKLTDEQILHNWNELIRVITASFEGERKEKILKLHEHFEERMPFIPAAMKEHWHNAFPGGYVLHVLNVMKGSKELTETWRKHGCTIDFTEEEAVFSALFHDLGKVGDMENDYYLPQTDDWRRNKLGEFWIMNPKINYMQVTDRTFYLLSQFDIKYSEREFLGIRLADGMFAEHNKSYIVAYDKTTILKTNLPYIIHAADYMSLCSERDAWRKESEEESPAQELDATKRKYTKKQTLADVAVENAKSSKFADFSELFDGIFPETKSEKKDD